MSEIGMDIDWWWIALIVVIGGAAAAFGLEGRVLRRRLLLGILLLWGAVAFAYNAIVGAMPGAPELGEEMRFAFRALMLVASAWTFYLGIDALRTW